MASATQEQPTVGIASNIGIELMVMGCRSQLPALQQNLKYLRADDARSELTGQAQGWSRAGLPAHGGNIGV